MMRRGYALRRLLLAVPTLVGLSLLVFALGALGPDPAERLAVSASPEGQATPEQIAATAHELGLDRPLPVRYASWFSSALHGDLGESFQTGLSVREEVGRRVGATAALAAAAFLLIVGLGISGGAVGALFHRRWGDQTVRLVALAAASVPPFFLAYVLVNIFAVRLRLLPVAGLDGMHSVVLPAVALAVGPAAMVSRLLRASLLDVLGEEYILAARAKGLGAVPVLANHAMRNAVLPVLTVLGATLGRMLEGAVVIEVVFAWPGLGRLTYDAITSSDFAVTQGAVLFGGVVFIALNLAVDLAYGVVDPRIRLGASA